MAHDDRQFAMDDPQCPRALAEDLAGMDAARVFVPAEVDRRIMAEARQRLAPVAARNRRAGRRPWWFAAGAGIGVAAAVAVFVLPQMHQDRQAGAPSADMAMEAPAVALPAGARDIDRSGRVDILDAYTLATKVEADEPFNALFDINNDGVVNHDDVDAIAIGIVKLDPTRRVDHDLAPGG